MKKSECDELLKRFECLDFQVVVNCNILEEGWDCPPVSCVVQMAPTLSPWKYRQRVGRGTRPCHELGKTDCLVLDYDWMCGDHARDLCAAVDLYDDGEIPLPKDVKNDFKSRVRSNEEKTLTELLMDAESFVRTRPNLDIRLSGQEVTTRTWVRDPSGVSKMLGVPLKNGYDLFRWGRTAGGGRATEAQVSLLAKAGVSEAHTMTKWGASKFIDHLRRRNEAGLATLKQVHFLLSRGVEQDVAMAVSRGAASSMIDRIKG